MPLIFMIILVSVVRF